MSDNTETYIIKLKDLNVTKGLAKVDLTADKAKAGVQSLNSTIGTLRNILGTVSVAFLGREVVRNTAEFEKFQAVLTNTLGSGSDAEMALKGISDFASKTPFAVDQLTNSYVKLANQGFTPVEKEMTSLGDLASSTGKSFDQLTEALIDAQVGEFERLKEFGIRANKEGNSVKFTFKGVQKQVAFTDTAIRNYVLSLGEAAGVSGSMAAISKTTGGQISNLGDKITQLYVKIGTRLNTEISSTIGIMASLIDEVSSFVDWISGSSDGVDALFIGMAALSGGLAAYKVVTIAAAAWTKIMTVAQWAMNVALTANPIGIVVVAIGALIAALVVAYNRSETFRAAVLGSWSAIKVLYKFLKDKFAPVVMGIASIFDTLKNKVSGNMDGIKEKIMKTFRTVMKFLSPVLKVLGAPIKAAFKATGLDKVAESAKKAFNEGFDSEIERSKDKEKGDQKKPIIGGFKDFLGDSIGVSKKGSGLKGGIGAGLSEIKAQAPKNFIIKIDSLVKELSFNTTNLRESSSAIREEVTKAMLMAVNDAQIIAE